MIEPNPTFELATRIIDTARDRQLVIATAESCTGGLIGAALTDIPGSSAVFDRGFITYSYVAKYEVLGVAMKIIESFGAVSAEVAEAMAAGALENSTADIAIAVTGIAGPGGGTPDKPVGLVWFGVATNKGVLRSERQLFDGADRQIIRARTVDHALQLLLQLVEI